VLTYLVDLKEAVLPCRVDPTTRSTTT